MPIRYVVQPTGLSQNVCLCMGMTSDGPRAMILYNAEVMEEEAVSRSLHYVY